MESQISLFDGTEKIKINKPIRLIELFAGYGSQHLALKYLGAEVESYKICEWAVKSIQAYKDMHFKDDNTDYSKDHSIEFIINRLAKWGISANYNEPMTKEQIKRMGENKVAGTITTNGKTKVAENLKTQLCKEQIASGKVKDYRIRKLTPKECFRLMGVRDEDFSRVAENQSNASLYHLAGDSIVVDVLMAIFKEMM